MNYRQLGRSTLKISEISYGCMSIEDDLKSADRLIKEALAGGINYFDTADLYQKGQNEILLGKLLKGVRQEVIIASKVGNQLRPDGSGWDWNPSKEYILQAVEQSLKRLQTDYIDLYQLHGGTIDDPIDETIEAFELLQQQGKIRYYGISSIRPNVIRAYIKRSNMVSVMMQYSLFDRRPEESCLDLLEKHNISVLVRGALAKGRLAGKEATAYLNYSQEEVAEALQKIEDLLGDHLPHTLIQAALSYVLSQGAVASAVVGMRTVAQVRDSLKFTHSASLSSEVLSTLGKKLNTNTYLNHR